MPSTRKPRQSKGGKNKKNTKPEMSTPTNRNTITVASKVPGSGRTTSSIADSEQILSSPPSTSPASSPEKETEQVEEQAQTDENEDELEEEPHHQPHPQPAARTPAQAQQTETQDEETAPSEHGIPVQSPTNALVLRNSNSDEEVDGAIEEQIKKNSLHAAVTIPEFDKSLIKTTRNNHNANMSYENSNLDEITVRQLSEDAHAYGYDLDWCKNQLSQDDLTPQEVRTIQLRILDLTHQIRHCNNRIEILQFQSRKLLPSSAMPRLGSFNTAGQRAITHRETNGNVPAVPRQSLPSNDVQMGGTGPTENGSPSRPKDASPPIANALTPRENGSLKRPAPESPRPSAEHKRPRVHVQLEPIFFDNETSLEDIKSPILALQRLGFWKCQLCLAAKYLLAGIGRSPAQPCKWPLRDISKMITHFTVMHSEHDSADRLAELGAALELNRGPFEYWLRRTRHAKIEDDAVDECIEALKNGHMPGLLRFHSNAAAKMDS